MTRGIKQNTDQFIRDLQAQYYTYGDKGRERWVQLAVRPIELWELAFPKEHLNEIVATTCSQTSIPWSQDKGKGFLVETMRLLLGAKKIPDFDITKQPRRIVMRDCVGTYPIGIKEDGTWPEGHELAGLEEL